MIRWFVVVFYTASIYAFLPFARDWQKWMRIQLGTQFSLFINLLLITSGLLIAVWIARSVSRRKVLLFMLLFLLAFALAVKIDIPEERIHLLQYGLLGALLARAICLRMVGMARFGTILLLGTLIGLGDELIQWVLPDRVFDWWDVVYNFAGVSFGALAIQILTSDP